MNTKKMTHIALMTAVICILAPMSIQIGVIPISFTNFAIYLSVYLLGNGSAVVSYGLYYLIGLMGLPVFSGFSGGIGKALGPTGGCLIGFFFTAAISGFFVDKYNKKILHFLGMILGTAVLYFCAAAWYGVITGQGIYKGFMVCVLPFVGIDTAKMIVAIMLGSEIKKRIKTE